MIDSAPAKLLERIHHLIALAASSNENEARNAAVVAVRMISNFGVTLSIGAPPAEVRAQHAPSSELAVPVTIQSKFVGRCRSCGAAYAVGERVRWARGKGAAHVSCAWSSS